MDVLDLLFISTLVGSVYLIYKFKIGQKIQKLFFKPDTTSALNFLKPVDPLSGEICERPGDEEKSFGWGDFYDVRIPVKQIRDYEQASAHAKEPIAWPLGNVRKRLVCCTCATPARCVDQPGYLWC